MSPVCGIFVVILAPEPISLWLRGAKVALLQNYAGPWTRGFKTPLAKKQRLQKFQGPNLTKKIIFLYFQGNFCKSLLFQRSLQAIWPLFNETIFWRTVPLMKQKFVLSLFIVVWDWTCVRYNEPWYMRQCLNELQKEYCVKTKLIALDWQWVTLRSLCCEWKR